MDRIDKKHLLLVSRNDKLIFETYTRKLDDQDKLHHIQSGTKSFTSLVFGIVRGAGYFENLDATLSSYWPERFKKFPDKENITLRHLLTMRSGIAFDNDDFSVEMYVKGPTDPIEYILKKPMYADPGEKFYYRDADPHLLSALIRHVTQKTVEEWAEKELFSKLGIKEHFWGKDTGGNSMGAHGLYLKPRDMVKVGQMIMNQGAVNEEEIVPKKWLDAALVKQIDQTVVPFEFGYYFWIVPELSAVTTWGHGGNFIFTVPEKRLVIVLVSLPDTDDERVGTLLPDFLPLARKIIEACDE